MNAIAAEGRKGGKGRMGRMGKLWRALAFPPVLHFLPFLPAASAFAQSPNT